MIPYNDSELFFFFSYNASQKPKFSDPLPKPAKINTHQYMRLIKIPFHRVAFKNLVPFLSIWHHPVNFRSNVHFHQRPSCAWNSQIMHCHWEWFLTPASHHQTHPCRWLLSNLPPWQLRCLSASIYIYIYMNECSRRWIILIWYISTYLPRSLSIFPHMKSEVRASIPSHETSVRKLNR